MPLGTIIKWDGASGILECDDPRIPNVPFFAHVADEKDIAVGGRFGFKIRIREGRREAQELQEIWTAAQHGDDMSVTHTGRVIKWITERGFGFVDSDSGDAFLHVRDLIDAGLGEPSTGDMLNFVLVEDPQGRRRARPIEYV